MNTNCEQIPAEIYRRAWVKLDKILSDDTVDETSKARIKRAYKKMEKRLSSLAENDANLSVRRIRKEDREIYGIPQNIQGNMITTRKDE